MNLPGTLRHSRTHRDRIRTDRRMRRLALLMAQESIRLDLENLKRRIRCAPGTIIRVENLR